jgi:hypothetical protein
MEKTAASWKQQLQQHIRSHKYARISRNELENKIKEALISFSSPVNTIRFKAFSDRFERQQALQVQTGGTNLKCTENL